jgi:hypothetical protein
MNNRHVTLKDLLDEGLIRVGETLCFKSEYGAISENGTILYKGKEFTSLSNWAKEVASKMGLTKHYNGWKVVYIKDKPLSYFRDLYFAFHLAQERNQTQSKNNERETLNLLHSAYPRRKRTQIPYAELELLDPQNRENDTSDVYHPTKKMKLSEKERKDNELNKNLINMNVLTSGASVPAKQIIPKAPKIQSSPAKTKKCDMCGTTVTPQWRRGPNGSGTLCNSCGVKWSIGRRRKRRNSLRRRRRGQDVLDDELTDNFEEELQQEFQMELQKQTRRQQQLQEQNNDFVMLDEFYDEISTEERKNDEIVETSDSDEMNSRRDDFGNILSDAIIPKQFVFDRRLNSSDETAEKTKSNDGDDKDVEEREDPEIQQQCREIAQQNESLSYEELLRQVVALQHEILQLQNDLGDERKKLLETQQKAFEYNRDAKYYIDLYRNAVEENKRLRMAIKTLEMKNFEHVVEFEKLSQERVPLAQNEREMSKPLSHDERTALQEMTQRISQLELQLKNEQEKCQRCERLAATKEEEVKKLERILQIVCSVGYLSSINEALHTAANLSHCNCTTTSPGTNVVTTLSWLDTHSAVASNTTASSTATSPTTSASSSLSSTVMKNSITHAPETENLIVCLLKALQHLKTPLNGGNTNELAKLLLHLTPSSLSPSVTTTPTVATNTNTSNQSSEMLP